eukprot:6204548-Pleurochrysis_carterae.AAC.5
MKLVGCRCASSSHAPSLHAPSLCGLSTASASPSRTVTARATRPACSEPLRGAAAAPAIERHNGAAGKGDASTQIGNGAPVQDRHRVKKASLGARKGGCQGASMRGWLAPVSTHRAYKGHAESHSGAQQGLWMALISAPLKRGSPPSSREPAG